MSRSGYEPQHALVRPARAGAFGSGWGTAFLGAILAVLAGLVPAVLAALSFRAASPTHAPVASVAKAGGLLFSSFHHVPLVFSGTSGGGSRAAGGGVTVVLAVALMAGTAIVGASLWFAGRAVGRRAGGTAIARGLHGAKVALPYAALCLGVALLARLPLQIPGALAPLPVSRFNAHPDVLQAALWPAAIAAVFGFLGGLASMPEGRPPGSAGSKVRAAVAGGSAMLVLGLAFCFVGLLVMAALQPDATRTYLHGAFHGGALRGVAVLVLTLLFVPNMAAWILFPSMGSCVGITGLASRCILSYSAFPSRPISPFAGATAAPATGATAGPPAVYLFFLLAPLVAVLVGGWVAARRSGATNRGGGAAAGALAGVAFAAAAGMLAFLARISVSLGGPATGLAGGRFTTAIGPDLLSGPLVALAWGVIGGAIGGGLVWRPRPVAAAGPSDATPDASQGAQPDPGARPGDQ